MCIWHIYIHAAFVNGYRIGLGWQLLCEWWIDCMCVCQSDSMSYVWNLFVKEGCGISCRHALRGFQICFPCHGLLTATKSSISLSESLHLTLPPNPPVFLCASQVWYLSGWVCYLQLEKAKEQQEREGREVTEEEKEEWKALTEAARSYLTSAKKVIQVKITS